MRGSTADASRPRQSGAIGGDHPRSDILCAGTAAQQARRFARATGYALLVLGLGGCSSSSSLNPINWWHGLQGGKIAEDRPPPPGASDPYPNLASVPNRPAPPDRDAMRKLTDSLIGDRTNAQYTAEANPLPDPSSPKSSPGLFGAGTLPPPPPGSNPPGSNTLGAGPSDPPPAASASLAAASAPPSPPVASLPQTPTAEAPAAPPSRAPVGAVSRTPLDPPAQEANTAPTGSPPATDDTGVPAGPPLSANVAPPAASTAALPPLPGQPPPRPDVAPPAPPPPAAPLPAAPMPSGADAVTLGFAPDSSTLSPTASEALKQFIAKRGSQPVVVTGYGDATSSDPGMQSAALSLGLSRAQAVASALAAAGVPQTAIRVGAEAAGRGASVRLLQ